LGFRVAVYSFLLWWIVFVIIIIIIIIIRDDLVDIVSMTSAINII
jgi:hypothetical protein